MDANLNEMAFRFFNEILFEKFIFDRKTKKVINNSKGKNYRKSN